MEIVVLTAATHAPETTTNANHNEKEVQEEEDTTHDWTDISTRAAGVEVSNNAVLGFPRSRVVNAEDPSFNSDECISAVFVKTPSLANKGDGNTGDFNPGYSSTTPNDAFSLTWGRANASTCVATDYPLSDSAMPPPSELPAPLLAPILPNISPTSLLAILTIVIIAILLIRSKFTSFFAPSLSRRAAPTPQSTPAGDTNLPQIHQTHDQGTASLCKVMKRDGKETVWERDWMAAWDERWQDSVERGVACDQHRRS